MTHKKDQEENIPPIDETGNPEEEKVESQEEVLEQEQTEPKEKTAEELAEEYLNDLKRCQAEFENYKKRQQESQKDLKGLLIEKLVLDIIPVLDNFRSATMHVPAEQKESPWVVGIQYIEKQLEAVLTDNGMQTIEVAEGEEFDPSIHEAISHEKDSDNESEKHLIATVIQKGYKFGDRVIRPARATVK